MGFWVSLHTSENHSQNEESPITFVPFLISGDADDQNVQATSHEARPVSSSIQQYQRVLNSSSHGARVMRSQHMPQVKWTKAKCKVPL